MGKNIHGLYNRRPGVSSEESRCRSVHLGGAHSSPDFQVWGTADGHLFFAYGQKTEAWLRGEQSVERGFYYEAGTTWLLGGGRGPGGRGKFFAFNGPPSTMLSLERLRQTFMAAPVAEVGRKPDGFVDQGPAVSVVDHGEGFVGVAEDGTTSTPTVPFRLNLGRGRGRRLGTASGKKRDGQARQQRTGTRYRAGFSANFVGRAESGEKEGAYALLREPAE